MNDITSILLTAALSFFGYSIYSQLNNNKLTFSNQEKINEIFKDIDNLEQKVTNIENNHHQTATNLTILQTQFTFIDKSLEEIKTNITDINNKL